MKPGSFDYFAPDTVEEALALLGEYGDEATIIAGGQSLLPLMNLRIARPSVLIDVNPIASLQDIEETDGLLFGAMVRHHQAEQSAAVTQRAAIIAYALSFVGHPAIRTRGTIGGSVAHSDPAAELPTVLTALDATVILRNVRGERSVAIGDFFTGFLSTAKQGDELVTGIRVDERMAGWGWGFEEFSRRHGDFALVGAAALVRVDDRGCVEDARLVFSGVGSTPVRAHEAEGVLRGERLDNDIITEAAAVAARFLDPQSDIHGSAAYRRHLSSVLARRALAKAGGQPGLPKP